MFCMIIKLFMSAAPQPHMPLFSIYSLALEQDQEQGVGLQQASTTLHSQTFIQVDFKMTGHFSGMNNCPASCILW